MKCEATNNIFQYLDLNGAPIPKSVIQESNISEYAAIVDCGNYKGVFIDALDMSSGGLTGTFKDWVACATIAYCKHKNVKHFVTQSSGNTANAIAAYCREFSQKVTIFYMLGNSVKIKPQFFKDSPYLELIAVDGSESRMKELTTEFSQKNEVPWLPLLEIQDFGNSVRADYVLQYCSKYSKHYDWHSQSLSSGYGVFGFYQGLERLSCTKGFKFLGVQQSTVSPFIKRFKPDEFIGVDLEAEVLIEPTLFRSSPTEQLYTRMSDILSIYGGSFSLVSNKIYEEYLSIAMNILSIGDLELIKDEGGRIVEKSGLIDLIGVLHAIDRGEIKRQERVLISLTGGLGAAPSGNLSPSKIVT